MILRHLGRQDGVWKMDRRFGRTILGSRRVTVAALVAAVVTLFVFGAIVQPTAAQENEPRIPVLGFVFRGNTVFSDVELSGALADVHGLLTLAGLEVAAQRVTRMYHDAGYLLAEAYLPEQEIDASGIVQIAVLEGRYGRIVLQNRSRLSDEAARRAFAGLREGDPIAWGALERATQLLQETPGVRARAVLVPAAEPGRYDVRVELDDGVQRSGAIGLDNLGGSLTGQIRATAQAEWYNVSGAGDRVSVQGGSSGGSWRFGRVGYQRPVGPVRVDLTFQSSGYEAGGSVVALEMRGSAQSVRLGASYPYVRRAPGVPERGIAWDRIDVEGAWEGRRQVDEMLGLPVGRSVQSVVARSSGTGRTAGGALVRVDVRAAAGHLTIDDAVEKALDDAGPKTAGWFGKLGGDVRVEYGLGLGQGVRGELRWQLATKNLHSSERLALGGSDGVRAYDANEASGDAGVVVRLERYGLVGRAGLQWTVFGDAGWVRRQMLPADPGGNTAWLAGLGIGLSYVVGERLEIRSEYAAPVGAGAGLPGRWTWQARYRW